ncbi:transport protein [Aerosticca soli]|uniref:Transport protein n=1 Tax=Aerosticca soli TaxID=2010829 RepID=A0A2Z6E158_9GAMM|nr:transport protein [Aerosticca soli]
MPPRMTGRHLAAIRHMLAILCLLALLYTVTLARELIIPLLLATFLGLALNPLVAGAARRGIPRWLSSCVLMLALVGGIGTGIGLLAQPALGWFHNVPAAIKSFVPKLKSLAGPLEAASRATQSLVSGQVVRVQPSRPVAVAITAWDVIAKAPKVLAAILTVILLVFFFLVFGDTILRRLVQLTPGFGYRRHTVAIVRGIQSEVSRYILTTVLINAALGLITTGMLWLYGMPDPLLWGTVAMLANFIPYVGAITTTTLLALVGLIHFDSVGSALLPASTFAGITILEGNFFTPMIQGRRMRLSPIAILLWLLVWGWLWGIPGALLAVPMLTSFKLIAERVRGWAWFARLVQR